MIPLFLRKHPDPIPPPAGHLTASHNPQPPSHTAAGFLFTAQGPPHRLTCSTASPSCTLRMLWLDWVVSGWSCPVPDSGLCPLTDPNAACLAPTARQPRGGVMGGVSQRATCPHPGWLNSACDSVGLSGSPGVPWSVMSAARYASGVSPSVTQA